MEKEYVVICLICTIVGICGLIIMNLPPVEVEPYTTRDVEILEIIYYQETLWETSKTLIRCHSETFMFNGISPLPMGNVTITMQEGLHNTWVLAEWERRE